MDERFNKYHLPYRVTKQKTVYTYVYNCSQLVYVDLLM